MQQRFGMGARVTEQRQQPGGALSQLMFSGEPKIDGALVSVFVRMCFCVRIESVYACICVFVFSP
jgi:hypothetical protein